MANMQTERFNLLRKTILKKVFEKKTIINIWRKIVRNQLRRLDLKDLYDHYDFNYNIEERASAIRNDILNGTYKPSQPLFYRIEKKYGVCRHLVIPQPADSLVLQVIVENTATRILSKQPSENAFYSRDKNNMKFPHQVGEYGLTWRQQWRKLQKRIYNFNQSKKLIVVTDISNYYDSIDIGELRKVFTSYAKTDEVVADLLFKIVEEISWKPDYLPYSERGLPTTNIEGIRLLAHLFLFEIDIVVKRKTQDNFTRWMDDVVFGVETKKEAVETISAVSDMLKSRGLALNLAKTNIYDEEQGYHQFQIEENRFLDGLEEVKEEDMNHDAVSDLLDSRFANHLLDKTAKNWDKVAKRYITAFSRISSTALLSQLPTIYVDNPVLRPNLMLYLSKIGYTQESSNVMLKIIRSIDVFDDLSLFQLCLVVTKWEIPTDSESVAFLTSFEKTLLSFSFKRRMPSDFFSILWFKAKYDNPKDLLKFIKTYENLWQSDSFLRRQVSAILSRLFLVDEARTKELINNQIHSGVANAASIASQIIQFSNISKLDTKLNFYLFPKKIQRPYPIEKFLVLCSVLNSQHIRTNNEIKHKILANIFDPYYLRWLKLQYDIS